MATKTLVTYDAAIMSILFVIPVGPPLMSIEDFLNFSMNSLSFLSKNIEANETIVVEEDSHPLDWDRLRDANDDYDSILFYSEREIVLKEGDYKLGLPLPKEMVLDEPSEDNGDDEQPLI